MIRWRFILTRLIVVVAVLMLLRWGLGPVAKYLTTRVLESVTGAKVEIAQANIGLFPPRVQYVGFQLADPRADKEMRDLVRAETIDLVIDGEALMRRRWVARDGKITGLQIGARRENSGHVETSPSEPAEPSGPSMLGQLFGIGVAKVNADAKNYVNDLETVRRSKAIRERWETEYDTLVSRARSLEKQIREIRDQARGIENPLRDWPELERTLAKANQARAELLNVRQAIDSLPQRMQADLSQLEEARRIDLAKVDRYVPGDLSDGGDFGIDIMASAVRAQVQRVRDFMEGGRRIASYTVVAPESERTRGVTHDFEVLAHPSLLVRRCEIGGMMRADGKLYAVNGLIENLSPEPELLAEPTRARLRLEGPEVIRVEYVRDQRDNQDVDLLTLHWPQTNAKTIQLGDKDDAGITISGGQRELWVQVRTEGSQIEGRLVSKQVGVQMDLTVDPKYADSPAVKSVGQSLAGVDRIEVDARFAGTWREIDVNVNTNLGQILRRASQDAIDNQVRETKLQLAAAVDQAYREQTQSLQQWLGSRQSEARDLMASADKSIEEMSKKVLDEVGDADAYLGRLRGAIRGRLK